MKMKIVSICLVVLVAAIGLTPTGGSSFEIITLAETVTVYGETIEIRKTAENFIVLYDSSGSMHETYKTTGKKKIELEKEILKTRNAAFPDLTYNAGLYVFTPNAISSSALKPFYEMKPYNKAEFAKAIDQLPTVGSGATPLQFALLELDKVLSPLRGHTVVFVVTDGRYTHWDDMERPVELAKDLARKHDVSFYVIDSSGMPNNAELQYAVSTINARSRVISYDQFIENPLLLSGALFVLDKRIVEKSIDIEKIIGATLTDVLFEFDSAEINPKYADKLKVLGEYMQKEPKARLSLSGFTDNKGSTEYNLALSHRRVESIGGYLERNFQISRDRMVLNYYGEANPVTSNDTEEGRTQNRRIEGFIFGL